MEERQQVSESDAISIDAYHEVLEQVCKLSLKEQLKLIGEIIANLQQGIENLPSQDNRKKEE